MHPVAISVSQSGGKFSAKSIFLINQLEDPKTQEHNGKSLGAAGLPAYIYIVRHKYEKWETFPLQKEVIDSTRIQDDAVREQVEKTLEPNTQDKRQSPKGQQSMAETIEAFSMGVKDVMMEKSHKQQIKPVQSFSSFLEVVHLFAVSKMMPNSQKRCLGLPKGTCHRARKRARPHNSGKPAEHAHLPLGIDNCNA